MPPDFPTISEASRSGSRLSIEDIEANTCFFRPDHASLGRRRRSHARTRCLARAELLHGPELVQEDSVLKLYAVPLLQHLLQRLQRQVKLCFAEGRSCYDPVEAFDEAFAPGGVEGHGDEVGELRAIVHQHVNIEGADCLEVRTVKAARDMEAVEAIAPVRVKRLMPEV